MFISLFIIVILSNFVFITNSLEEDYARAYLAYLNKKTSHLNNLYYLAEWNYSTNLTEDNLKAYIEASEVLSQEAKEDFKQISKFNWKQYKDESTKRQFRIFSSLDILALPNEKHLRLTQIISHMQEVYAKAKFCSYKQPGKCDLQLEPDLTQIMASSRDPKELEYYWLSWREKVGGNLKENYTEYVKLMDEAAKLNGFEDASGMALRSYEYPELKKELAKLWNQIKPVYVQLHAYVRNRLRKHYGSIISEKGPLPAHILGNMWGQSWEFIANLTLPFPERKPCDITDELKKQDYTAKRIFKTAEDFFLSINMTGMPQSFWEKSLLEKPKDREVVCHASAWDFADGKDFRIRQCTRIEQESFATAHHEMGHVQYYMQYRYQPAVFQAGANPAFHEAVGDTISLSVTTMSHFKKIGLRLGNEHPHDVMNHLFLNALSKIPFFPFGYLVDLWRWHVFSGKTKPKDYNCHWWALVESFQGLEPPKTRSEEDFDAASKYHIIANYEYIAYFLSHILQYQFHKALCIHAGQYGNGKLLHDCDIYSSKKAGNAFKSMLELGSSKPWPFALKKLTGEDTIDASPLLEYFEPITKWLVEENKRNRNFVGWECSEKFSRCL